MGYTVSCPIDFSRKTFELSMKRGLSEIKSNNHENAFRGIPCPEFTDSFLDATIIPAIMVINSAISRKAITKFPNFHG